MCVRHQYDLSELNRAKAAWRCYTTVHGERFAIVRSMILQRKLPAALSALGMSFNRIGLRQYMGLNNTELEV